MKLKHTILRFPGNKKLQNFAHILSRGQDGSIMVLVAVAMVALIGFSALVLDLGVVYFQASRLQNALDSAVLAGVKELPADDSYSAKWVAAEDQAIALAGANGFTLTAGDLEPVYKNGKVSGIQATSSVTVAYNFARIFNINSGTFTRTATAELSPAGALGGGAVPLSITDTALASKIPEWTPEAGLLLTIKCSSNRDEIGFDSTGESGWFGALLFPDSQPADFADQLINGYDGTLYVDQILKMNSGNISGPTLAGFSGRITQCTDGCTWDHFVHEPLCPRVVFVPVVSTVGDDLGNNYVRITSFAAFFLQETGGSGKSAYIKAWYLPEITVPNTVGGATNQDFGVYVTRLSN